MKKIVSLLLLTLIVVFLIREKTVDTNVDFSYQWPIDQSLNYQLRYNVKGEGAFSVDVSAPKKPTYNKDHLNIDLQGTLLVSFMEQRGDQFYLNATFSKSLMTSNLGHQENIITPIEDKLHFQFVMHSNGSINKIKMLKSEYSSYGDVFRDILSLIELPLPIKAQKQWIALEKHTMDSYPVTMKVIGKQLLSNVWNIEKNYEKLKTASIQGPIYYEFDRKKGLIQKVSGLRVREHLLAGKTVSQDKTAIELVFNGFTKRDDSDFTDFIAAQEIVEDSLKGERMRLEMRKRSKVAILDGRTMTDVKNQLVTVDKNDSHAVTKLSRQVVALLELEPQKTNNVAQWLFDYEVEDERFGAIASALTYVGSDEAQHALVNVLNQLDVGEKKQITLMGNLAFVEKPSLENEDYFRGLLVHDDNESVFSKANLALGIIANHLPEEDKSRQLNIFSYLKDQLELSSSEKEERIYINAIGNVGIPEQLPIIQDYVNDDNNILAIRKEAVVALRFVKTPESEGLLLNYLNCDEEGIRIAAAEAMTFSEGSSRALSAYKTHLFQENNISVLKHMLKHLSDMSSEYPDSIALMDSFINQCGHPSLCDYANQLRPMM